jgi:hypothetical protein
MNTNKIFSLSRFNRVFCNLFIENRKPYLGASLGTFAVFIIFDIVYCFSVYHNVHGLLGFFYDYDFVSGLASGFMMGIISVSAIFTVKDMGKTSGRILALTTPATTFEKWLSRWIVCTPISLLVFFIIFFAVCGLHIIVLRYFFPQIPVAFPGVSGFTHSLWLFLVSSLFVQSLCMLSAYFSPKSPAKLLLIVLISVLLLGILGYMLVSVYSLPVIKLDIPINKTMSFVGVSGFLTIAGWALSYICFKKLDVTNR